ncbi:MAG: hypothetical protein O3A00_06325 [Planctomycetota bacterium]|nr:hypothetical protein [Planctomycetota bacterium]
MSDYQLQLIDRELLTPRGDETTQHLRRRPSTTRSASLLATCAKYRPSQDLFRGLAARVGRADPFSGQDEFP